MLMGVVAFLHLLAQRVDLASLQAQALERRLQSGAARRGGPAEDIPGSGSPGTGALSVDNDRGSAL